MRDDPVQAMDRTGATKRRGRAGAALALLGLAALCGCAAGPKEARPLPPGIDPPSFISQSSDARGTILLGTTQGVFRSVDAGASWSRTRPGVYRALSAGFTSGSTIVSRGRLFQRGNLSFDHVNKPTRAPFFGGVARSLAWLPGGKLYALVENAPYRLFVTVNSARTWWPRPAFGLPDEAREIAAAPVFGRGDILFAACLGKGLWRSLDGGLHWSRLGGAGRVALAVTTTPARRGRVLVAGPEVRWSDDYGKTGHRTGFDARLLAADPRNPDIFFAVTDDGYLRASSDGGRHW